MKQKNIFAHLLLAGAFIMCPFFAFAANTPIDISGISNPENYVQNTHTQTYIVGQDGVSLFYRNKDTGMKLRTAATTGSKIAVTDNSINKQAARGAAATSAAQKTGVKPEAKPEMKSGGTPPETTTSTAKTNAGKLAKGAGAAVGTAVGGYMIYESTKGNTEHNVGNLVGGVMGGVTAGAAIGTAVGSPGIGTAIGAVVGGAIAGSQLFSETDCLTDPVTGDFTCCNTAFNKGQRQAKIGDHMFCQNENGTKFAGVRQCVQGKEKSTTAASWWDGLWKDDFWAPECQERWCVGEEIPANGMSDYVNPVPDTDNFCWRWTCVDGYTRSGDVCISNIDGTLPVDPYAATINKINQLRQQIISECGNM